MKAKSTAKRDQMPPKEPQGLMIAQTVSGKQVDVILSGEFTFADNPKFRDLIEAIDQKQYVRVTLDFSELQYVDSAALGMLLLLRDALSDKPVAIVLKGATGQVQKMFQLSHFDALFDLES